MEKYNAIILGAGSIAGGYDNLNDNHILTHAHAYIKNPAINLLGFYDVSFEQATKMAKKWNVQAFKSLEDLDSIDIISVCTPDQYHFSSVQESIALQPKFYFLEKPAGTTKQEVSELLEIATTIPIQVNYSRRFIPEFQELAKRIQANDFGKYQSGVGYYGKGFLHNGSHMRDLLEFLLGPIQNIKDINQLYDFYENDPTKTALLNFEQGTFFMQGVDCRHVTIFEFDLIFEKRRIRIINNGKNIEEYAIRANSVYQGYYNFELETSYDTQYSYAMANAVQNIVNHLEHREPLLSPMRDFI